MKILRFLLHLPTSLRQIKRNLSGCCLIILLGMLLACLTLVYLVGRASAQTSTQAPYDIMLLIDNSNSMFEKAGLGSDPEQLRIQAARLFISYLGVDSFGPTHRLGVIFFGGEARLIAPLTPLADETRRAELNRLIDDPSRMVWTDPVAALTLAHTTLMTGMPSTSRRAVVLLTDGKPEWTNDPTPQEKAEVTARLRHVAGQLAAQNISLFVILLQNEATDADPEIEQTYIPLWHELATAPPLGRFYRARQSEDLPDIYHDIVVILTERQTTGVVVQTQVEREMIKPVAVEPNLAQVTFVIRKSEPSLRVDVIQPNGRLLHAAEPGVQYAGQPGQSLEEIWAVAAPPAGVWQIRLGGQGGATVWKDFYRTLATPTADPSSVRTATTVPTFTPTLTRPAASTATPSLKVTSTPTARAMMLATLTPALTATKFITPVISLPSSGSQAADRPLSSLSLWPNRWYLAIPIIGFVLASGGWLWFKRRQARPRLSGILRLIGPLNPAASVVQWLDLDRLNRSTLEIGASSRAGLHLPQIAPTQPTPSIKLTTQAGLNGELGVGLVVAENGPAGSIRVNDQPVHREKRLHDGDVINLGDYKLRYENLRQRRQRNLDSR